MLKDIIAKDPNIYSLKNESLFFHQLNDLRRQYPDLANKPTLSEYITYLIKLANLGYVPTKRSGKDYSLLSLGITDEKFDAIVEAAERALPLASGDRYVTVFRLVIENLMLDAGKLRWLDKGPNHVLYLEWMLSEIEGSRAVEIVRDPRAVLSSRKLRMQQDWLEMREKKTGISSNRKSDFDPVLDSLRWRQMIRAGAKARNRYPERVLKIRYEDLVGQPETVVPQLTEFLEMSYVSKLLDVNVVNSTSWAGDNKAAGIVKVAVDKWRKTLTQEELHVIQTITRKEMNQLGYEPAPLSSRFSTYMRMPLILGRSTVRLGGRLRR